MTIIAYRDRVTGAYPISLDTIRAQAGVLFGEEPPAEVIEAAGVDPVQATPRPPYDPETQTLAEGPIAVDGGVWRQTWVVSALPPPPVDPFAHFIPPSLFRQRAEAIGIWPEMAAYLAQNPAQMIKVLTLENGIDPADAELNAGLEEMQIPAAVRAILLAPRT